MILRYRIILETISFLMIAAIIGSFLVWRENRDFQQKFLATDSLVSANDLSQKIIPTVTSIPKVDFASQTTPDGTKILSMTRTQNSDKTYTYIFSVEDESGDNKKQIYTVTIPVSENMSVPFNAWSPDNQYLFIQKNTDNALVFKASGESITDGQLFFDIKDSFEEKVTTVLPRAITGWAADRLIIVNTFKTDSSIGPSYWFEVPSKAVVKLSSLFE